MDIPLLIFEISINDKIKALISAVFSSFALNIDMMYPKETECSEYEILFFRDDRLLVLLAVFYASYQLYDSGSYALQAEIIGIDILRSQP